MRPLKSGSIRIDPKLHTEFRQAAKADGRTIKWMVEKWVQDYLRSRKSGRGRP